MKTKRKISVATSCFNEKGNIKEFYDRVVKVLKKLPKYDYEIVIADNCSQDGTRDLLRKMAKKDSNLKIILNSNNFGALRSGVNSYLSATGDAVVVMVCDLQEPPEVIPDFIKKWEKGSKVVVGVKKGSRENLLMGFLRSFYYWLLSKIADSEEIIRDFNGFGLYDRQFMDAVRNFDDPCPYFRGIVSEVGFKRASVGYFQKERKRGKTTTNLYFLFDYAMNGFVNHSKLPLRLATFMGFTIAVFSLLVALVYFIYKLCFWDTFSMGIAPVIVGLFFFSAVQLIFIGIIGEYIGAIYSQTKNRPLVVEEERINFDEKITESLKKKQ